MATVVGTCCCGGGIVNGCCGPCVNGVPLAWHLSVAGIVRGIPGGEDICTPGGEEGVPCEFCHQYNGDFVLRHPGFPFGSPHCVWIDFREASPECDINLWSCGARFEGRAAFAWRLSYDSSDGYWYLAPNVRRGAAYRLHRSQWNCFGPNTLPRYTIDTQECCQNWPPALTVVPGDGATDGCACHVFEAVPERWSVDFTNITSSGDCLNPPFCPEAFNRSHILTRHPQSRCYWSESFDLCGVPNFGGLALQTDTATSLCGYASFNVSVPSGSYFYRLPLGAFNPLGANTLTRYEAFGQNPFPLCRGFPQAVTIAPA